MSASLRCPQLSWRFTTVWGRNFLVWKKLFLPSVLGNLADPLIYMLGLGYGLGSLLPQVGGTSYVAFLAAGTVCYSTMNAASFEALYSAFSRMHVQKTWEAILNAPLSLEDVLLGELFWAATKSLLSGFAILLVIWGLGLSTSPLSLLVLPIVLLVGLCFASLGLIVTTLAPNYDFFMYYFTLLVTPMSLLSGVFFPVEQLPTGLQMAAQFLPLTHAIAMVRPLLQGVWPGLLSLCFHCAVLVGISMLAFLLANTLAHRRLMR